MKRAWTRKATTAAIASDSTVPRKQAMRMYARVTAGSFHPDEGAHSPAQLLAPGGEEALRVAKRAEAAAEDLRHPGARKAAPRQPVQNGQVLPPPPPPPRPLPPPLPAAE